MPTRADVLRLKVDVENKEAEKRLKQTGATAVRANKKIQASNKGAVASMNRAQAAVRAYQTAILGWTAAIGGGVFALNRLAQQADRISNLSQGFETLTGRINQSSDAMLSGMTRATKGLVTEMDLMQQANNALLLGLPITVESMEKLTEQSFLLGRAMGIDASSALTSMITGIGRQSRLMLDNLGIIVDSQKAYENYARSIGKTTDELTDAQKKLAFYLETVEQAEVKVQGLASAQFRLSDAFNKLKVGAVNQWTKLIKAVNELDLKKAAVLLLGRGAAPDDKPKTIDPDALLRESDFLGSGNDRIADLAAPDGAIPPLSQRSLGTLPPLQLAQQEVDTILAAERDLQRLLLEVQIAGLKEGSLAKQVVEAELRELDRASTIDYLTSLGIETTQLAQLFAAEEVEINRQKNEDILANEQAKAERAMAIKEAQQDQLLSGLGMIFNKQKEVQVALALLDMGRAISRQFSDSPYPTALAAAAAIAASLGGVLSTMRSVTPGSSAGFSVGGAATPAVSSSPQQNLTIFIEGDLPLTARAVSEFIDVQGAVIGQSDGQ